MQDKDWTKVESEWNGLSKLNGKTLLAVFLNADKTAVRFDLEGESLIFDAVGDCCSSCWIEHVTVPSYCEKFGLIESVDEIDLGLVIPTRQEVDKLYGIRLNLKCEKSYGISNENIFVEFRNSSNGYYGGELKLRKSDEKIEDDWTEVKGDS